MFSPSKNQVRQFLSSLSAADVKHIDGTLLPHLEGTCDLLESWGNRPAVSIAGLCHALYGTEGFALDLVSPEIRSNLQDLIGEEAEELVYLFGSCDRGYLYSRIINGRSLEFRNRFTGAVTTLESRQICDLLEVTVANELVILRRKREPSVTERTYWLDLFEPSRHSLSNHAWTEIDETLRPGELRRHSVTRRFLRSIRKHAAQTASRVTETPALSWFKKAG